MRGNTFSIRKDDWKKYEKYNVAIAFNVMYAEQEKVYPAYVSKHQSDREKQVILLMIPNGEKHKAKSGEQLFHYLVVKKLSALLRGITSKEIWWFLLSELPSFL